MAQSYISAEHSKFLPVFVNKGVSNGMSIQLIKSNQLCLSLLGITLFALASTPLIAQKRAGDTLHLNLDAVTARLASNPTVARARLLNDRARGERARSGNVFPTLPELEYARRTDGAFGNIGEGGWDLELSQELEIGGEYLLRRTAADAMIAQTEFEARAVELDMRTEGHRLYASLVAAEARGQLLDSIAALARRLDTITERLYVVTEISELDRNMVHIARAKVEFEWLNAAVSLSDARSELRRLLNVTGDTVIVSEGYPVKSISVVLDSVGLVEASLASGSDDIIRQRPDWQALHQVTNRISAEWSLAARSWIPRLRLGIGVGNETTVFTGQDAVGGSELVRNGLGTIRSENRLLSFRLGMGIPLPLSGAYDLGQGGKAIANAELAIAGAEQRMIEARIRADITRSAARLRSAAQAYLLYSKDIAPLVVRNRALIERGYKGGELSSSEVVTQQEQLLRAGESLIDAEWEYHDALTDFERAIAR